MSGVILGFAGQSLVSQGTAYGLLIGLGATFCGIILAAVYIQRVYLAEDSNTSEMFMVANRTVGVGLTASAVFSSWMWINETVFAAAMCYRYGIAVPMWWGSGLSFQIALMAVLGVLAKIRVPYAHTSLEIIKQRYGKIGHVVYIVLNLSCNIFGCASMILTGSQLIYGISGVHFAAATVIIPVGVVLYTAIGGLKATFLTDYLHTAIALVLIIYFTLSVLTNEAIGGLGGLYDKIIATAGENKIATNYQGSLLTMKAQNALIWSFIVKFGNLALVVMDTAFWQKSFATKVNATVPGYNLAALAIFAVPWALGTVIGLTARAIHNTPIFPTYPAEFTLAEVSAGLVMPYTIQALIGPKGIVAFFVLLFMALTSTISSSMIAVSSILSFDLYKTYINPKATDKRLVHVSHLAVVFHGVFITGFALALNYGGANMTWIGYFRPILTCPGIIPLILTLTWSKQTRLALVISPLLGIITGLGIWLGTAYHLYGVVNMFSTGQPLPAIYGAIGSLFSPGLYSVIISQYKPYTFDWREFLRIELAEEAIIHPTTTTTQDEKHVTSERITKHEGTSGSNTPSEKISEQDAEDIVAVDEKSPTASKILAIPLDDVRHPFSDEQLRELHHWYKVAWIMWIAIVLITFVLWPIPLYRDYIFTRSFFAGWVVVAIIWQFFAVGAVVVFPLYDGWTEISKGARGTWKSVRGWKVGRGEA